MTPLLISLAIIAALAVGGFASGFSESTQATDLWSLPDGPARFAKVQAVIRSQSLNGMDPRCLDLCADMENGIFEGLESGTFSTTNSLFNRHQGNGVVGQPNSDGVWTGEIYYASADDPNLRKYASLEDSVQDFVQWAGEFPAVQKAAQAGDISGFIDALAAIPYSTQSNYAQALNNRAAALGLLS